MNSEHTQSPCETLSHMIQGYKNSQLVYLAAKLGVADLLAAGPKSADEIVISTGTNAQALCRIMNGFVWCGLVIQREDKLFELTSLGECLRSDASDSLKDEALFTGEILGPAWSAIHNTVKTGITGFDHFFGMGIFQYLTEHPEIGESFNKVMVKCTAAMSESVLAVYDFSPYREVVDVGGGFGALLTSILKKHPGIHGVLFDISSVIQGAKDRLEKEGLLNRCTIVAGDFFNSVPQGGDLYILKSIIHDWDEADCLRILKNCHKAMGTRGKILLVEWIMPEIVDNATNGVNLDLTMLMVSGGQERTEREYRALFDSAGFQLNRIIPTPSGKSLLEGIPKT
ncbi:MAG: acetylserotonin O-methyltransferase [Candidatus Scalindua sp.]|nr:acetylserotonin O-methyltransferase [Candidatus Scalindua sp.]